MRGRVDFVGNMALDRADETGAHAGMSQEMLDEKAGGRLAIRARNANDVELPRRAVVEVRRAKRQGSARILDEKLRRINLEFTLDHKANGTMLERIGGKIMPVDDGTGNAEEKRTRFDFTRGELEGVHLVRAILAVQRLMGHTREQRFYVACTPHHCLFALPYLLCASIW